MNYIVIRLLPVPAPEYKKPTDYVSGLFRLDVTQRPRVTTSSTASSQTTTITTTKLKSVTTTSTASSDVLAQTLDGHASNEEVRLVMLVISFVLLKLAHKWA
jgi:hypothetical protein